jgi:hypothetical protein
MDAFYLSISAPRGLPEPEYRAIRHTIDGRHFRATLSQAVRQVFGRYRALNKVRVRLSR